MTAKTITTSRTTPAAADPAMMPIFAPMDSGVLVAGADSELAATTLPLAPAVDDAIAVVGLAVAAAAALAELMEARSMKSGPVCAAPMPAM